MSHAKYKDSNALAEISRRLKAQANQEKEAPDGALPRQANAEAASIASPPLIAEASTSKKPSTPSSSKRRHRERASAPATLEEALELLEERSRHCQDALFLRAAAAASNSTSCRRTSEALSSTLEAVGHAAAHLRGMGDPGARRAAGLEHLAVRLRAHAEGMDEEALEERARSADAERPAKLAQEAVAAAGLALELEHLTQRAAEALRGGEERAEARPAASHEQAGDFQAWYGREVVRNFGRELEKLASAVERETEEPEAVEARSAGLLAAIASGAERYDADEKEAFMASREKQ